MGKAGVPQALVLFPIQAPEPFLRVPRFLDALKGTPKTKPHPDWEISDGIHPKFREVRSNLWVPKLSQRGSARVCRLQITVEAQR